jgi:hypothetical protein
MKFIRLITLILFVLLLSCDKINSETEYRFYDFEINLDLRSNGYGVFEKIYYKETDDKILKFYHIQYTNSEKKILSDEPFEVTKEKMDLIYKEVTLKKPLISTYVVTKEKMNLIYNKITDVLTPRYLENTSTDTIPSPPAANCSGESCEIKLNLNFRGKEYQTIDYRNDFFYEILAILKQP